MTEEMKKKRDELAETFDKASWYGRRNLDYFEAGFDACCKLMEADNKKLVSLMSVQLDMHEQILKLEAENAELKAKVLEYQDGVTCIMCEKETEIKTETFTDCGVTVSANVRVCKHCDMNWITFKGVM